MLAPCPVSCVVRRAYAAHACPCDRVVCHSHRAAGYNAGRAGGRSAVACQTNKVNAENVKNRAVRRVINCQSESPERTSLARENHDQACACGDQHQRARSERKWPWNGSGHGTEVAQARCADCKRSCTPRRARRASAIVPSVSSLTLSSSTRLVSSCHARGLEPVIPERSQQRPPTRRRDDAINHCAHIFSTVPIDQILQRLLHTEFWRKRRGRKHNTERRRPRNANGMGT